MIPEIERNSKSQRCLDTANPQFVEVLVKHLKVPNNIVYSNKVITAGDTYIIDWEKLVLGPGDMIQANSNVGNAIVATVSTIGV
jgi:hypothetical protein